MNTLGRGLLGDATKHQDSRPRGFRHEYVFMFSLYKSLLFAKHVIPGAGPSLAKGE